MNARRIRQLVGAAVTLTAALLAWVLLAPQWMGGDATYVITSGSSMQPRIHEGDLVLVRRSADYRVGDVVAYTSRDLGQIVLHRIVRLEGGRFVTKGDSNGWLDSERPARAALHGKLWFRIPAAGKAIAPLRSPRNAGILAAVLSLLAVLSGGAGARRRRRGRGSRPAGSASTASPLGSFAQPKHRAAAAAVLGAGGLGCLAVAFLLLGPPPALSRDTKVAYAHTGSFSYSAPVPRGPAYEGPITTGKPVFLRLVEQIAVRFDYRLESDAPRAVSGTARLRARVSDTNGWTRTIELQAPTSFSGDHVTVRGDLPLRRLRALIDRAEAATGVVRGGYALSLLPEIDVEARIGERVVKESFSPRLDFQFDPLLLQLPATTGEPGTAPALEPRQEGSVASPVEAVAGGGLGLSGMRILALAAGIGLLGAALGLALWSRGDAPVDELTRVRARYRSLLIPISSAQHAPGRPLVAVATMEALVRLAEYAGRPVHELDNDGADGTHSFLVEDDAALYRYRAYATDEARQTAERTDASPLAHPPMDANGTPPNGHPRRGGLASVLYRRKR